MTVGVGTAVWEKKERAAEGDEGWHGGSTHQTKDGVAWV